MHRRLAISGGLALLFSAACGSDSPNQPEGPSNRAEQVVTATGGTVRTGSGASVEIPANALDQSTTISVNQADASIEKTVKGTAYDFGPEGAQFKQPVVITIPFNADDLPAGTKPETLRMVLLEEGRLVRVDDSAVDVSARTVRGKTTHFSRYAVGLPTAAGPEIRIEPQLETDTISATFGRQLGLRITITAADAAGVSSGSYSINGGAPASLGSGAVAISTEYAFQGPAIRPGPNEIRVDAINTAGASSSETFQIHSVEAEEIGTTDVTIVSPADGASVARAPLQVVVHAKDTSLYGASIYKVEADGRTSAAQFKKIVTPGQPAPSEASFSFGVSAKFLQPGPNTFRVEVHGRDSLFHATGAKEITVYVE